MRISAKIDYALRALLVLAARPDEHVSSEELAQAQEIPHKFLEAILVELRRTGLVRSRRGSTGGHRIGLPPGQVSVADVVRALSGPLTSVRGECPEDLGYGAPADGLRTTWIALRAAQRGVLEAVTLADLVGGSLPAPVAALAAPADAWTTRRWTPPTPTDNPEHEVAP